MVQVPHGRSPLYVRGRGRPRHRKGTTPNCFFHCFTHVSGELTSVPLQTHSGTSSPQQPGQLPQCRLCSEVSETVPAPWCQEDQRALGSRLLPTSPHPLPLWAHWGLLCPGPGGSPSCPDERRGSGQTQHHSRRQVGSGLPSRPLPSPAHRWLRVRDLLLSWRQGWKLSSGRNGVYPGRCQQPAPPGPWCCRQVTLNVPLSSLLRALRTVNQVSSTNATSEAALRTGEPWGPEACPWAARVTM